MPKFLRTLKIVVACTITLLIILVVFERSLDFYVTHKEKRKFSQTHIDECIKSQDCFWYAFVRHTGLKSFSSLGIVKWDSPIKYHVLYKYSGTIQGNHFNAHAPMTADIVSRNFSKIASVFPYDFTKKENVNYFVTITENLQENNDPIYRDNIIKIFGQSLWDKIQPLLNQDNDFQIANVIVQKTIRASLLLLKNNNKAKNINTPFYIMKTLGFGASETKLGLFKFDQLSNNELNELHLLLIKALYDERLKPGMSYYEAKNIFPVIYAKVLFDYERKKTNKLFP